MSLLTNLHQVSRFMDYLESHPRKGRRLGEDSADYNTDV